MTDSDIYFVVTSEDGRYSVWAEALPLPWGWAVEGFRGPRAECLAHINEVWTDLRPSVAQRS